jgi:hypothetical protein
MPSAIQLKRGRDLDLAGTCDTLIADTDGIYHPTLFNDRMLLGMKGTMSGAESHILRARLDGGIRNKAARGELRRGLPVGLVWGEGDGEIRLHPDEAVVGVIAAIFEQFDVGLGPGRVAVAARAGTEAAAAARRLRRRRRRGTDVDRADLPRGAHRAHPPPPTRAPRFRARGPVERSAAGVFRDAFATRDNSGCGWRR